MKPKAVENLKAISKLYGYEYQENQNKESKHHLIDAISNYTYNESPRTKKLSIKQKKIAKGEFVEL